MKNTFCVIFSFFLANFLFAQPWSFVKEKEGIKAYTRLEPNCSLKSFKGEADISKTNRIKSFS